MKHLFSFALISFLIISLSQACIHDQLDIKLEHLPPEDTPQERLLQGPEPIRIIAEYSTMTGASTDLASYIKKKVMPAAIDYFNAALSVTPLTTLKVSSTTTTVCGLNVPSIYRTGVEADLVLLVTAEASDSNFIAWAKPCILSGVNKRAVFGQVNFNLNFLTVGDAIDLEGDILVTIHEITHVLGFSPSLFSYFPSDPVVSTTMVNGINTTYYHAEPLTSRLRKHFNCSTLKGAYLENQGAAGSIGSHFERKMLEAELMTASSINDARISEFTLAFLESTGWYTVDYFMAEPVYWGKNKGCTFLSGACIDKTTFKANFDEFCSPLKASACTFHRRSGGYCGATSITTNAKLLPNFDYWGNKTIVTDSFADNCPYIRAYSNVDCHDPKDESRAVLAAEVYGTGSLCFMGTLYPTGALAKKTAYCLKYNCEAKLDGTYTLKVIFGSTTATCTSESSIKVAGYYGLFDCPDPNEYCSTIGKRYCKRNCYGRGTCNTSTGLCKCNAGWTGADCSLPA